MNDYCKQPDRNFYLRYLKTAATQVFNNLAKPVESTRYKEGTETRLFSGSLYSESSP